MRSRSRPWVAIEAKPTPPKANIFTLASRSTNGSPLSWAARLHRETNRIAAIFQTMILVLPATLFSRKKAGSKIGSATAKDGSGVYESMRCERFGWFDELRQILGSASPSMNIVVFLTYPDEKTSSEKSEFNRIKPDE